MSDYAGLTLTGGFGEPLGGNSTIIGDINGDGFADFAVSVAPSYFGDGYYGGNGAVYIVFGSDDLPRTLSTSEIDGTNGFRIDADANFESSFNGFGSSVVGLGDVNDDGVDDFAIGQISSYSGFYGPQQGVAYVILGGQEFAPEQSVSEITDFRIDSPGYLGEVLNLGDINGDGFDDVGVFTADAYAQNYVYVDFNYLSDLNGNGVYDQFEADNETPTGEFQYSGEIVLRRGESTGYVIFGTDQPRESDNPIANSNGEIIVNLEELEPEEGFSIALGDTLFQVAGPFEFRFSFLGDSFGLGGFAGIGDINGDGIDDIGVRELGAVSPVFDNIDPVTGRPRLDVVVDGNTNELVSLTPADPEITTGGPGDYILLGSADPAAFPAQIDATSPAVDFIEPDYLNDPAGIIAGVGDVSGDDGFDDIAFSDTLAVGDALNPFDNDLVGVRILPGLDGDPFPGADTAAFITDSTNTIPNFSGGEDQLGFQVGGSDFNFEGPISGGDIVRVGDISGDGIDDFVVLSGEQGGFIGGPPILELANLESVRPGAPIAYLIFGSETPFDGLVDVSTTLGEGFAADERLAFKIIGLEEAFGSFGITVNGLGDIDNDGTNDLIFSAPEDIFPVFDEVPVGRNTAFGGTRTLLGGLDTFAALDQFDGIEDGYIDIRNIGFGVELAIRGAGFLSQFQAEGDSGVTLYQFEVTRTGDLSDLVSFDFNVTGSGFTQADAADFVGGVLPSGTVTFTPGSNVALVTVEVQGDLDIENSEDFTVTISNGVSGSGTPVNIVADATSARIFNDDQPVFLRAGNASVEEGNADADARQLVLTVFRSGDTNSEVEVDFDITLLTAAANDFEAGEIPSSGTLSFASGQTTAQVILEIAEDQDIEANESVQLDLSNARLAGGSVGSNVPVTIADSVGIGTILNDDFPPRIFLQGGGTIFEGTGGPDTEINFTLLRQGNTTGEVEVEFSLNPVPAPGDFFAADSNDINGIAIDGTPVPSSGVLPLSNNTVTFADGQSEIQVTVFVNPDSVIEPRERFEMRVDSVTPLNGVSYDIVSPARTATILNDDGRPPVIPPGVEADVFGDPHIVTLDGLGYDFQAVGEYILVETLPERADGSATDNPFQVQVRFEPVPGSELVSVTTRMAVQIGDVTVELDAVGPDQLLIDGVAPTAEQLALGVIDVDGDGTDDVFIDPDDPGAYTIVLNALGEQLKVKVMDGSMNVCVFLSDEEGGNQGNVRGLMGDADGPDDTGARDISDDLALRDGTVLEQPVAFEELYGRYADSWRLDGTGDKAPIFSNQVVFPDNFPLGVLTVDDLPESLRDLAIEAALAAGLNPDEPEIFDAAVLDFALTGNGDFFEGALGLAADPQANTEPTDAPEIDLIVGVTNGAPGVELVEGDEGTQAALFNFYRIGSTEGDITITFSVGGDVDDDDLVEGTGGGRTVTILDGEDQAQVAIEFSGDLTTEDDEALTVSITDTDPAEAVIGAASTSVTILTDDFGPDARDDLFATDEDTQVAGNLLADNGDGIDDDPDGDALTVVSITEADGTVRTANGGLIILDSGAHLRVNSDGTFTYNPFGFAVGGGSAFDSEFDQLGTGEVGEETFTYTISDGNGGEDTATVTIGVRGINDAPVAVVDGLSLTEDDASASLNVLDGSIAPDVDPEGGPLTVTQIRAGTEVFEVGPDAPAEINFDSGGRLTIDADGNAEFFTEGAFEDLGEDGSLGQLVQRRFDLEYTIADEEGLTDSTLLQIFVGGVNDAPEVAALEVVRTEENVSDPIELLAPEFASDAEGDDLSVENFGMEASDGRIVNFELDPDTGSLTILGGQFEDLAEGEELFLFTGFDVSDGQDASANSATILITGVNDAPVANTLTAEFTEDEDIVLDRDFLLDGIIDVDTDLVDLNVTGLTCCFDDAGEIITVDSRFDEATQTLTIFNDQFQALGETDTQVFDVTYTVTDGGLDDAGAPVAVLNTVTVTISGVNDAPDAVDDSFETDQDTQLVVDIDGGVLANDEDAEDDVLGAELISGPANGQLALNEDGSFTYTPREGFSGEDFFTYVAFDPDLAQSSEATVSIIVNAALNTAPVAVDDFFDVDEDNILLLSPQALLSNDFDLDGDTLVIDSVTSPDFGALLDDNGNIAYIPPTDFNGTATFTYTITDGNGGSDTATVTIDVNPVNDIPIFEATLTGVFSEDEDIILDREFFLQNVSDVDNDLGELTIVGADFVDETGAPLNIDAVFDRDAQSLTLSNEQFQSLNVGVDSFFDIIYEVSDGGSELARNSVALTILGENDAPEILSQPEFTFGEDDERLLINVEDLLNPDIARDVDNDFVELSAVALTCCPTITLDGVEIDLDIEIISLIDNAPVWEIAPGQFDFLEEGQELVFEAEYQITDGVDSVLNTATVTILGANDAPEIVSEDAFSVPENQLFEAQILVEDVDDAPEAIGLEISGGADADLFALSPEGVLTFVDNPDFEAPADANGDNQYEVQVTATDDSNAETSQDIVVSVLNDPTDDDPGGVNVVRGTDGIDFLRGTSENDLFLPGAGRLDLVDARGGGSDTIVFGPETTNGVAEIDYVLGFGQDDFLDLGGVGIAEERNFFGRTFLTLEGDGDVIVLFGTSDFDEENQLIGFSDIDA